MTAPLNPLPPRTEAGAGASARMAWSRITNAEVLTALRASNATVSKFQVENIQWRHEVQELRDALADAYSQLGVLQQKLEDAQCALLSAQGGQQ